jgi:hypothetical protein
MPTVLLLCSNMVALCLTFVAIRPRWHSRYKVLTAFMLANYVFYACGLAFMLRYDSFYARVLLQSHLCGSHIFTDETSMRFLCYLPWQRYCFFFSTYSFCQIIDWRWCPKLQLKLLQTQKYVFAKLSIGAGVQSLIFPKCMNSIRKLWLKLKMIIINMSQLAWYHEYLCHPGSTHI